MNRIDLLAYLASDSKILCDVGCDHAYVLIKAILNHNVKKGIAADVALGPLSSAKRSIEDANLSDKITLVLSDGFKSINEDFDTAIIAGMGGILIKNILDASLEKIEGKKLILEPNSDASLVRSFLANNNFIIIDEYAIIDQNKYYEIIVAKPGIKNYTLDEIKYGPILLAKKPKEFIEHYNKKISILTKAIDKITDEKIKSEKLNEIEEYKRIIGE